MQKNPSNLDELFQDILDLEIPKKSSNFTPLEVTVKDPSDGSTSVNKMKNVIIIGVMGDDKNTLQSVQGEFTTYDKLVLVEALNDTAKRISPKEDK